MVPDPKKGGQARFTQIRVDDENSRVGGLSERACEVDGGRRLAVGSDGARDRDDRELDRFAELFDRVAQLPVLFRLE